MAAWGFTCANCNKQFAQFRIEDTLESYFFPEKPDFPKGGKEFGLWTRIRRRAHFRRLSEGR